MAVIVCEYVRISVYTRDSVLQNVSLQNARTLSICKNSQFPFFLTIENLAASGRISWSFFFFFFSKKKIKMVTP